MKELTQVFKDTEIHVDIIDENNMYFDVSGIAKKYGKNITEWKNSKRTKEIIKVLLEKSNELLNETELILVDGYQTKIHNSLFVSFARFVSVDFEIASNKIIMDILLGEKHLCNSKYENIKIENNKLSEQLKISQKQTKEAKRKTHAYPRGNGFETVTRFIEDNDVNMTPHDLNTVLVEVGILKAFEVPIIYYKSPKMSGVVPLIHVDTVIKILDDRGIKRGVAFLDSRRTLF